MEGRVKISLGALCRDSVTGFSGIVTGRSEYLYATPQVLIVANTLKDGVMIPAQWIDEARVVEVSPSNNTGHFI